MADSPEYGPRGGGAGASRRAVLKLGLGGLLVAGAAAGGLQAWPGASAEAPAVLQVLSPRAHAILVAVAEAVCPDGPPWPSPTALGVAAKVDAVLARMDAADADQIVVALHLLESALAGAILDQRVGPFSSRPLALRRRSLEGWKISALPVRQTAFKALRGLCATAYFADPRTFAAVGYPGPPDFGQDAAPDRQPAQDRALWDPTASPFSGPGADAAAPPDGASGGPPTGAAPPAPPSGSPPASSGAPAAPAPPAAGQVSP
jgi:hypothetical protein